MVERKLKYLLKARILSWLVRSILASLVLFMWRLTGSGTWFFVATIYAIFLIIYLRTHGAREYKWMYISLWLVAALSLSEVDHIALIIGLSIFFGFLLFLLTGIMQIRFNDIKKQVSLFYFLLVFSVASLYALSGPIDYSFGMILVIFVFLYMTGKEYMKAEIGTYNFRIAVYNFVLMLITAEIFWIASLLSIGFLNIASLVLVFYIVGSTIITGYFNGMLTKKNVAKDTLFFAVFSISVLILSMYV